MNAAMLEQAYEQFDTANAEDPNTVEINGEHHPKELVFAQRLTETVLILNPDASEVLRLASRCQHIRRWEVPRSTQPMGRAGYLKWRAGLKNFHAEQSAKILHQVGYDQETIEKVQDLNQKKNMRHDRDCQTLEDALCIVFLRYQFDDLIAATEEDKMVRILQKTWAKMSESGREEALKLEYSDTAEKLLQQARA